MKTPRYTLLGNRLYSNVSGFGHQTTKLINTYIVGDDSATARKGWLGLGYILWTLKGPTFQTPQCPDNQRLRTFWSLHPLNIIMTHAAWLTEWGMLRVWACFMLSRVSTPSSPVIERERKREREKEREWEREKEWERDKEGERERGRKRKRERESIYF